MFHPAIKQKLQENLSDNNELPKASRRRGAFYISQQEIREENLSKN